MSASGHERPCPLYTRSGHGRHLAGAHAGTGPCRARERRDGPHKRAETVGGAALKVPLTLDDAATSETYGVVFR